MLLTTVTTVLMYLPQMVSILDGLVAEGVVMVNSTVHPPLQ